MTDFIYTTYIKTTPEKLWAALTNPEFIKQYWGHSNISDWKKGSEWRHIHQDNGSTLIIGKVVESVPSKRLVLTWAAPDDKDDVSQVSFDIGTIDDMVVLKVVHDHFKQGSTMAPKVSGGWPRVLSSLKTYLETGKALPPKAACAA